MYVTGGFVRCSSFFPCVNECSSNCRGQDEILTCATFDAVLLCSGPFATPYQPDVEGSRGRFTGKILHMHSYRTNDDFKGQTVLVVGNGNSAGDVAVDISHVAKQVGGVFFASWPRE